MCLIKEAYWFIYTKLHYFFHGGFLHHFAMAFWELFLQLWIFLLIGMALSALLSVFWNAEKAAVFFGNNGSQIKPTLISVFLSTLIGVLSPMPIYVVIPLIVALANIGMPIPVLFAYLVASPLMNPVLFTLTAGAMGYEMAVARCLSAIIIGILSGYILHRFNRAGKLLDIFPGNTGDVDKRKYVYQKTLASFFTVFFYEFYRLFLFSAKYFLMGIVTAAAVKILIPPKLVMDLLGGHPSISILAAVAAGVPLYACGGGTIPVMKVLLALGMNKGAVLAFFISGPATKISTLVTLSAAIRKEAFFLYLFIAFFCAATIGFIYNTL